MPAKSRSSAVKARKSSSSTCRRNSQAPGDALISSAPPARTGAPRARRRRLRIGDVWPRAQTRRRVVRAFIAAPLAVQVLAGAAALVALWGTGNLVYQVVRKPTELFYPVTGVLAKRPSETWEQYEAIFRQHATAVITPAFLAALAQVEGTGDPMART